MWKITILLIFVIYWWFNKVCFFESKDHQIYGGIFLWLFTILYVSWNLFSRFVAKILKINYAKICSAKISALKVLDFNNYQKSNKTLSFIYADLEYFIKKIDGCKNNSGKWSTIKLGKHVACGYSMSMIWIIDAIENNIFVPKYIS